MVRETKMRWDAFLNPAGRVGFLLCSVGMLALSLLSGGHSRIFLILSGLMSANGVAWVGAYFVERHYPLSALAGWSGVMIGLAWLAVLIGVAGIVFVYWK